MCRNLIVSYFPAKPLETPCPSQCDKTSSHQGGEAAARLQLRGAFELDSNPARTAVTLRFFSGKVASSHPCPLRRHELPKEPSEHQATRMRSSVTSSGVSTSVAHFDDMTEGAGGLPARRSVPPLPSSPESFNQGLSFSDLRSTQPLAPRSTWNLQLGTFGRARFYRASPTSATRPKVQAVFLHAEGNFSLGSIRT